MGYQCVDIPEGFSLYTITFKDVANANYDIQDITPQKSNGDAITADRVVTIQRMDSNGYYLNTIYKWRPSKTGWCSGLSAEPRGTVLFPNAEAVCVNNTSGEVLQFRVSGEVVIEPYSMEIPKGFTLIGNMTPVEIDMQDITPLNADGSAVTGDRVITIQKMDTAGYYLNTIYKWRPSKNGWCSGLSAEPRGMVMFKPGEAACVNNSSENVMKFKYKSPVAQ